MATYALTNGKHVGYATTLDAAKEILKVVTVVSKLAGAVRIATSIGDVKEAVDVAVKESGTD